MRFTADAEVHAQLLELQALMRHQVPDGDLGKIIGCALGALLERVRKRKFAEVSAPRSAKPEEPEGGRVASRQLPAAIRRAVSQRDEERCTWVSASGKRCNAREFLEFDHRAPWSRSREHSVEGIRLLCRAHNQHAADRAFGRAHMERFRGRASEPGATPAQADSPEASASQLDLKPVDARRGSRGEPARTRSSPGSTPHRPGLLSGRRGTG